MGTTISQKEKKVSSSRSDLRVNGLKENEIARVLDMGLCFNPKTKRWDGEWINSSDISYFINKDGILALPLGDIYNIELIGVGLTSLHNMPITVEHDFDIKNNEITSLEGAPTKIGGNFDCSNNMIDTLEPLCSTLKVKKFYCNNNKLTDLKGCSGVIDLLECNNNPLTTLKGMPQIEMDVNSAPKNYEFNAHKTRLKNYAYIQTDTFNITSLYKISKIEHTFVKKLKVTKKDGVTKIQGNYLPTMDEREYYNELAGFMAEAGFEDDADGIWWHEDVLPNIKNLFGSVKTVNKFSL